MFIYRWMHSLETDPSKQFQFHKRATLVWIGLMFLVPFVPPFHFIHRVHDTYSSHTVFDANIFISLLILEISLWANAFTHFGALSSALAAMHGDDYPEDTKITHYPQNQIHDLFSEYDEAADELDLDSPMESLIPSQVPEDAGLINAFEVAGHSIPLPDPVEDHDPLDYEIPRNLNP